MFVKLMNISDGRETLYECDRFFIAPTPGSFTESRVDLEGENSSITIGDVNREVVGIYVMNNDGKTIEAYPPNSGGLQRYPNGISKAGEANVRRDHAVSV